MTPRRPHRLEEPANQPPRSSAAVPLWTSGKRKALSVQAAVTTTEGGSPYSHLSSGSLTPPICIKQSGMATITQQFMCGVNKDVPAGNYPTCCEANPKGPTKPHTKLSTKAECASRIIDRMLGRITLRRQNRSQRFSTSLVCHRFQNTRQQHIPHRCQSALLKTRLLRTISSAP